MRVRGQDLAEGTLIHVTVTISPNIAPEWVADWRGQGLCATADPDALFVQGKAQRAAKAMCKGCPVMAECLADALDNRTEFGVWGGMTERERRALLRRRPEVQSWTLILATAKSRAGQAVAS